MFDSFNQADGATTRKFGGTGLGLTIAKQLANMMDGEVGVESEIGKGSVFWFTARFPKQANAVLASVKYREGMNGLRTLIVDDNATNRMILQHSLEAWSMYSEEAVNGPQALERLRKCKLEGNPYNLILLDMHMPGMDGLELARTVHSDPDLTGTPMIMLSSLGNDGGPQEVLEVGISSWMTKPVRQSVLYDCIIKTMAKIAPDDDLESEAWVSPVNKERPLNGHLLLAEDNTVNQAVALNMLKLLGCSADVAENGRKAVDAALLGDSYDLVLMDVHMPEMDGFTATGEIRQRRKNEGLSRQLPIIALTANAMQGDKQRCLNAGMDDYLTKPFTLHQLRKVLEKWLPDGAARPKEPLAVLPGDGCTADKPKNHIAQPRMENLELDQKALDNIRSLQEPGDPSVLGEIIGIYLENSPRLLRSLREAIEKDAPEAMQHAAHTLKSSSANLGATTLAALCKELEMMGREKCTDGAPLILDKIEELYPKVCKAMTAVCETEAA